MKKRYNFILGLLAILTVFAISACKDPNSSDNDNSGNTRTSPYNLYSGTLTLKGNDFETVVYVDLTFSDEMINLETGEKSYCDWSTQGYTDSSFTEGSEIGGMSGKYEVSGNSVTLKITYDGKNVVSEQNSRSYTGTTTDNWNTISFTDEEFSGTLSKKSWYLSE